MKTLIILLIGIAVIVLGYYLIRFGISVAIAKKQADKAVPYQKPSEDRARALLVLGDSTAVGVGADKPEDTVAGRLSKEINATLVENYAVSGAVVADIPGQMSQAKLDAYHLILVQIGANDIINFRDADEKAAELGPMLAKLPKADQVILITAGNVGGATIFPPGTRKQYTERTLRFHEAFTKMAAAQGITYVNLYQSEDQDPFSQHPEIYLSPDGLHPSSEGYRLWFEKIREALH